MSLLDRLLQQSPTKTGVLVVFLLSPLCFVGDWGRIALKTLTLYPSWTCFAERTKTYLPLVPGGFLSQKQLSFRKGDRPITTGMVTHYQVNQISWQGLIPSTTVQQNLVDYLKKLSERFPSHLIQRGSSFCSVSKQFSSAPSRSTRSSAFPSTLAKKFLPVNGDFLHLDPITSNLYVILHPQDAYLVVKTGWGELHPLAGFPCYVGFWLRWVTRFTHFALCERFFGGGYPPSYTLIYTPRNEDEVNTVKSIMAAAVCFACGLGSGKEGLVPLN